MAKKFVRGITDIKTITNQDFYTNNVNDLLSDGKNNYIHRKKQDGSEEYHNLTNNLKTVTSDNTDLLEITNNNETTNSAVFHPKHDSTKQNTLTNNNSIGVVGTGLQQLYMSKYNFQATGALLKTHIKSISGNTTVEVTEEEFNFIVKLNKNVTNATFTINTPTASKFSNIITAYGSDNNVIINGCLFTLNDRILTVSRTHNVDNNYLITFSDII